MAAEAETIRWDSTRLSGATKRIDISLPVGLTTTDVNEPHREQQGITIDVSPQRASLRGIQAKLGSGRQSISRPRGWQEQFLIAWAGAEDTVGTGLIDISAVDPASSFWNDLVETHCPEEPACAKRPFLLAGGPNQNRQTPGHSARPIRSGYRDQGEVSFEPDVDHAPSCRRFGSGVPLRWLNRKRAGSDCVIQERAP